MPRSNFLIRLILRAQNFASAPVRAVERSLTGLETRMQSTAVGGTASLKELAGAFTALVVARRITDTLFAVIQPAVELEEANARLAAATALASDELKILSGAALQAATRVKFSPKESIDGIRTLRLAVSTTDEAVKAILPTLSLAQGFFEGKVAPAADLASKLVRNFGDQAGGLSGQLNKVIKLARAAGVEVNKFSGGFDKLGAAAALAGSNFDEATQLFALGVKGGLPARQVTTGLVRAFSNLAREEKRVALETLGLDIVKNGKLIDAREVILQMAELWKTVSNRTLIQSQVTKALGGRAIAPLIRMFEQLNTGVALNGKLGLKGAEIFRELARAGNTTTDALSEAADKAMEPVSQQLLVISQTVQIVLAKALMPLLNLFSLIVTPINRMLQSFMNLMSQSKVFAFIVGILTAGITSLVTVIGLVVASKLAWFGISRIVAGVLSAANINVIALTASVIRNAFAFGTLSVTSMVAWAASMTRAIFVGRSLSAIMTLLTVGAKGFGRALLGPIGLLILAAEILMQAFDTSFIDIFFGKKANEKEQGKLTDRDKALGSSLDAVRKAAEAFNNSSSVFSFAVKEWVDATKQVVPKLDQRGLVKFIEKQITKVQRSGGRTETIAFLQERLGRLRGIFARGKEQGGLQDESRKLAGGLAQGILQTVAERTGSTKQISKVLEAVDKNLIADAAKTTGHIAAAAIRAGAGLTDFAVTTFTRMTKLQNELSTLQKADLDPEVKAKRALVLKAEIDTAKARLSQVEDQQNTLLAREKIVTNAAQAAALAPSRIKGLDVTEGRIEGADFKTVDSRGRTTAVTAFAKTPELLATSNSELADIRKILEEMKKLAQQQLLAAKPSVGADAGPALGSSEETG